MIRGKKRSKHFLIHCGLILNLISASSNLGNLGQVSWHAGLWHSCLSDGKRRILGACQDFLETLEMEHLVQALCMVDTHWWSDTASLPVSDLPPRYRPAQAFKPLNKCVGRHLTIQKRHKESYSLTYTPPFTGGIVSILSSLLHCILFSKKKKKNYGITHFRWSWNLCCSLYPAQ